ncbi:MAG: 2-oxoacid:acceptor oxidoreductase subunit alpha [Gammaproteobacteria bacterium]|nr:2-oxoacid:acceptor oxidoreductase subunit alpha [Gammaproteobacteria bacterium]NNF49336.1 2-oxoacid:acceptor oxidoreductase subunit alpha [Woeseiaceae bacterium]MBT8094921.1 2-oxoacid:acceptor oxidoreductase subunit alpha [Gammaproteobacteria bacterium]MBT8106445.1 2-oxoacid:acceptor oxidoreductase subunit alpha [Gammaproteobacteria bacterium]NNK26460.1 2-oxoacid:acceptor oxidoreductase subunit alpha [Woeseiaceae bacterium]
MAAINDVVIKIATVNGTGSASANGLLRKAIFRMGVPVVGKNYFPSNIQGLPTWYEIRVTGDDYHCRSDRVDIMVAMNAQTYARDMAEVEPGGCLIYDSTWPRSSLLDREDITIIGVPLSKMCNENFDGVRARILMKNIAYVGVIAALVAVDLDVIKDLLEETFADKAHLIASNMEAIHLGFDYAAAKFSCPLPARVEKMDKTKGHIVVDGNTAAGLGCMYAGATVGAWYPITPSTSLMDAFRNFCSRYRVDPETGKRTYCIIQAEDELAAIGMVLGASWSGARSFTPTSGPGISLMSEFIGFAYYAEIPAVIFNVQRVGPSTGMPTRTQQCDLISCAYASHGDTKHVLLFPADPAECFYMSPEAFDLAERLQTPVMVLTDLDIGMNDWMVPELEWDDDYVPDRGKVYTAEDLEKMEKFHRYLDVDGDGIPYRTLPGVHPRGAYFTRGSGHSKYGGYTEDSDEYQEVIDRLLVKWETARTLVPEAEIRYSKFNKAAILTLGSGDGACKEALDRLEAQSVGLNYCRVKAFPFTDAVRDFIDAHDLVYVVEQNRDAQLRTLLINDIEADQGKLVPLLHYNGMPINAGFVVEGVLAEIKKGRAA